jgi:hypothetical protein
VRQAGEKRRLTPTGMVEAFHGEVFAVDGVVRLIYRSSGLLLEIYAACLSSKPLSSQ